MSQMAGRRRGVTSGMAALGVVLATVLVWWLLSGDAPEGPQSGDEVTVGGGTPAEPGYPGSAEPRGGEQPPHDGTGPHMTNSNGVPINGYVVERGNRLALNYTTGVPECYGVIETPEVEQSDDAVTITLTLVPPDAVDGPCIELAVMKTVRVGLDAPLGERAVLDGSYDRRVSVEPASEPFE